MNKILAILAMALITASCSHYRWLDNNKNKICNEYCNPVILHDSIYIDSILTVTKLDTAYFTITIGCDSLKQAYIKALNEKTGQIQYKYILKDNVLSIKAYTDTIKQLQLQVKRCKEKTIERKIYIKDTRNNWYLYVAIGVLLAVIIMLIVRR